MTTPDSETFSWLRLIAAFVVVAGLLGAMAAGLKFAAKRGLGQFLPRAGKGSRLKIVETLALDIKRRVVIVRCDDTEHILLLGTDRDLVVSSQPARESHPVDKATP